MAQRASNQWKTALGSRCSSIEILPFRGAAPVMVCFINRFAVHTCGCCRAMQAKGLFFPLLLAFRHCCNAYFHWCAAARQRKAQGFPVSFPLLTKGPRNLAPEQSQSAWKTSVFKAYGFVPYALRWVFCRKGREFSTLALGRSVPGPRLRTVRAAAPWAAAQGYPR